MLKPEDVFTPNSFPLKEHNVYASREQPETDLRDALSANEVPIIYGDYGVGKTTLVKYFFRAEDREGRFVHLLDPEGKNVDDLAKIVLEKLGYEVTVGSERKRVVAVDTGVDAGFFTALKIRLNVKGEVGDTIRKEAVVQEPTDQGLIEIMANARVVIAIDEMHKASDGFRLQLANLMKAAKNAGGEYPKFVVLGTAPDATALVKSNRGIDRFLVELRVPPLADGEAEYVITEGMRRLDLAIDQELVRKVIRTAAGAPALLQGICLDMARNARRELRAGVTADDLNHAIERFLRRRARRLTEAYITAVPTVGERKYRKQILRAMAESDDDYVTLDDIRLRVSTYVGEDVPATALSGPLRELKDPKYGQILTDVRDPTGTGRVHNRTSFSDPSMKAFVRVISAAEQEGVLPADQELRQLPAESESAGEG